MQLIHWLPKPFLRHKTIDFLCKIGLQKRIIEISFNNDSKTIVDLLDPEPRNVFINREFEPHFFDIANACMPQDGIFFDLGANVGFCSFGLISSRPKSYFHIFEASPRLINLLVHSMDLYKQHFIKLNRACVSDKEGKTIFCLNSEQSGQSHVATSHEKGIEVNSLILDKYCKDREIDRVDLVKIDLEGHELPALKGWTEFLENQNALAIYIEIIPENQARYGHKTNAPLVFLESLGYRLYICKCDDFGYFGNEVESKKLSNGSVKVSFFKAENYPDHFSTDILALPY